MLKTEEEAYMDKHLELFGNPTADTQHNKEIMKTLSNNFTEVDAYHLIDLINNPRVRRHIPICSLNISNKNESMASVNYTEQMWINEGYGSNMLFI